jgi:hypothetical protein
LDWTKLIFDLIDLRSFSNLWYWIALAVAWSSASHWVLGIPYDMVLRARRVGGQAEDDLTDITRVNVSRILYIVDEAGVILLALLAFAVTTLILTGFVYGSEFAQALVLILLPLSIVGAMSVATARKIHDSGDVGEALHRRLAVHRLLGHAPEFQHLDPARLTSPRGGLGDGHEFQSHHPFRRPRRFRRPPSCP